MEIGGRRIQLFGGIAILIFTIISLSGLLFTLEQISQVGRLFYWILQDLPFLAMFLLFFYKRGSIEKISPTRNRKQFALSLLINLAITLVLILIVETKGMSVFLGGGQFLKTGNGMHLEPTRENLLSLPYLFVSCTIAGLFLFGYLQTELKKIFGPLLSIILISFLFSLYHLKFGKPWMNLNFLAETFFVGIFFAILITIFKNIFIVWPFLSMFEQTYYVIVDMHQDTAALLPNALIDMVIIVLIWLYLKRRIHLAIKQPSI